MRTLDDDLNDLSNVLVKSVNLHHSPSQEQSVVFFFNQKHYGWDELAFR